MRELRGDTYVTLTGDRDLIIFDDVTGLDPDSLF